MRYCDVSVMTKAAMSIGIEIFIAAIPEIMAQANMVRSATKNLCAFRAFFLDKLFKEENRWM